MQMEATPHRDLVIGLDCDGVLASGQELWEALFAAFPECIPNAYTSLTSYDWPRKTPESTELCLRLSADVEFTKRFSAIPHMAEAIRILHRFGWEIHIITARPAEVYHATQDWLQAQKVRQHITAVHCTEDKAPLAQKLGCRIFVEDNLHTAEKLGALGIRSYLMNATYNQAPVHHSIRRDGWPNLLADILVYQCTLQPWLVPAVSTLAQRIQERIRRRLAEVRLAQAAEPQTAA